MTRKITRAVARIKLGVQKNCISAISMQNETGDSRGLRQAMWMMLQAGQAGGLYDCDWRNPYRTWILDLTFAHLHLDWQKYVKIDPEVLSPHRSGPSYRRREQGKTGSRMGAEGPFAELANMMVDADLAHEQERLEGTQKRN